jgi:hypothetical protein
MVRASAHPESHEAPDERFELVRQPSRRRFVTGAGQSDHLWKITVFGHNAA